MISSAGPLPHRLLSCLLLLLCLQQQLVWLTFATQEADEEESKPTESSPLLYSEEKDGIHLLTSASDVLDSDRIWMVQLFRSEQSESQELATTYKALGQLMKGVFPLAAVDVSTEEGNTVATELNPSSKTSKLKTPSVFIVTGDSKDERTKPIQVGGRGKSLPDLKQLAEALMEQTSQIITKRSQKMGAQFHTDTKPNSNGQQQQKRGKKRQKSQVIQLNASNFQQMVYDNPQVIAVAFTAPWCGHCKNLQPEWEQAAEQLASSGAVLGWLDATIDTDLASQYNVKGYPTIKVFPGGKKTKKDAQDYPGERSAPSIVQYMLREVDRTGVPPEIPELTNQQLLLDTCDAPNKICVLAALPHILDSGAAGRNKYKDTIAAVAKQFRGTSAFSFFWFEYTAQPALEQALDLSFGAPALVALSVDRKAYAVHHGAFTEKPLTGFLHSITTGRQTTIPLSKDSVPKVETVEPWDGQDGKPIEDEIPLSEIMGDEF